MMRDMTLADLSAVVAIEHAVQPYPWTQGNFSDALASHYLCQIDETDGAIRGYAVLMPVVDEAELLTIGVAKTQQRKGVGRAMLNEIFNRARGNALRRVFLEVRDSNIAAISLYRSVGFKQIGVRRAYYQNANGREDALVMACDLVDEARMNEQK